MTPKTVISPISFIMLLAGVVITPPAWGGCQSWMPLDDTTSTFNWFSVQLSNKTTPVFNKTAPNYTKSGWFHQWHLIQQWSDSNLAIEQLQFDQLGFSSKSSSPLSSYLLPLLLLLLLVSYSFSSSFNTGILPLLLSPSPRLLFFSSSSDTSILSLLLSPSPLSHLQHHLKLSEN